MGDIMNTFFKYLKYIGLFFIFIIIITIVFSLINLTGFASDFLSKLSIILTAISFFIISMKASNETKEKGYILGLKLGLICIIMLILLNLIFFQSRFSIDRLIYYTILLASSVLGGSFGKNFKLKSFGRKSSN